MAMSHHNERTSIPFSHFLFEYTLYMTITSRHPRPKRANDVGRIPSRTAASLLPRLSTGEPPTGSPNHTGALRLHTFFTATAYPPKYAYSRRESIVTEISSATVKYRAKGGASLNKRPSIRELPSSSDESSANKPEPTSQN
ncbi:hypothetical protein YC2023_092652 [Brassica napus]